jgi:GT2 family glycosyltransferase
MLLRRSVLDVVGYFDERYFLYAEDLDLSRRINTVARTLFVPSQTVVHEYRSRTSPSLRRLGYAAINLTRYFNKWGWIRDADRDRVNRRALEQFSR